MSPTSAIFKDLPDICTSTRWGDPMAMGSQALGNGDRYLNDLCLLDYKQTHAIGYLKHRGMLIDPVMTSPS